MFWTRVFSGIVLLIILGIVFVSGGAILNIFLCAISIIGLYEYYRAVKVLENKSKVNLITCISYVGTIGLYVSLLAFDCDLKAIIFAIVLVLIGIMAVYVLTFPKYVANDAVNTFFGFCYVPIMLSFVYLTRMLPEGKYLVWLVFMCSWICDIFAYCVGMLFGKHKLAPVLSPKKSIEGAVGGVVFSALFGGGYGYFIKDYISSDINIVLALSILCALGACVSQIGDLTASAIKRNHEIKDYGHLIPGHGGILDRFDSVIITAPMVYMVALLFMGAR